VNIVSLTTIDGEDEEITLPIAWLSTKIPQVSMRLPLRPPVKLELTQGSGPVAICGIHEMVLTGPDDFSDEDDDEEEGEMVPKPESPELKAITDRSKVSAKRKAESQAVDSAKKSKKTKQIEVEEEDTDEDDEDYEDEEMDDNDLRKYLNKVKGAFNGKAGDDEDDTDEEEDYEDEDEDEDEDESEEEEPPKKAQKTKTPQVKAQKSQMKEKTPKQEQKPKTPLTSGKKGANTPAKITPASGKKGGPPKSIGEIQAKLLRSPSLPKKVEKFNNFLKNTFKVEDPPTQKQLWDYVQKNKK
jgi:hypothetical protein